MNYSHAELAAMRGTIPDLYWFRLGKYAAAEAKKLGIDPGDYILETMPRTDDEWDAYELGLDA